MKKSFNIAITSILCVMPIITADLQPVLSDTIISQDEQNEYEIIVEGNASYGNKPVTGKSCVVTNSKQLKKKKVGKGDIVIAPAIHSTWYPELMDVSGIIVEKGDDTSHAIALGKKLDIPVIVGAVDATKKIVDGQTIACDPVTRNVYHIAHADSQHIHFDTLVVSGKNIYQTLPEKLGISNGTHRARRDIPQSNPSNHSISQEIVINSNILPDCVIPIKENKVVNKKVKNLFNSHIESFSNWVSDTKTKLKAGRYSPRWVLKLAGCDDFAVDCIPLSFVFFDSDNIAQVIKSLETDDNLEYIGSILEECKKRPGDVNWAGFVAHNKNASTIPVPQNINREKLMKDPKAYIAVQDCIDEWERKIRIAAGLFARYCVENKLSF